MSRPVIVVGDRTSHGGVVLTGSPFSDVDGKGIARIGDKVTCPQKGHGSVTTIVTGDVTDIIDGSPVARHGDKTACGAMLISSQMLVYVDNESDSGGKAAAAPSRFSSSQSGTSTSTKPHDLRFLLLDSLTNVPLARQPYRLEVDGQIVDGKTDDDGYTETIATGNSSKSIDWHILGEIENG